MNPTKLKHFEIQSSSIDTNFNTFDSNLIFFETLFKGSIAQK